MTVAEKKVRIWMKNFGTTAQGLSEHKLEFSEKGTVDGIFNRPCCNLPIV
jgi:hypothetical protein